MSNLRAVRVPAELWGRALETAKANGTTVSEVIRDRLAEYAAKGTEEEGSGD